MQKAIMEEDMIDLFIVSNFKWLKKYNEIDRAGFLNSMVG